LLISPIDAVKDITYLDDIRYGGKAMFEREFHRDIQRAIEIEALRCFRRIIRAQELASFKGADGKEMVRIASIEISQATRDFDKYTTAARPAQALHSRVLTMLEDSQ
jgi:hypothetical protein